MTSRAAALHSMAVSKPAARRKGLGQQGFRRQQVVLHAHHQACRVALELHGGELQLHGKQSQWQLHGMQSQWQASLLVPASCAVCTPQSWQTQHVLIKGLEDCRA